MAQSETPQLQREGLSLAGGYVVEHDSAAAATIEKYHCGHVYGLVVVSHGFGNCRTYIGLCEKIYGPGLYQGYIK